MPDPELHVRHDGSSDADRQRTSEVGAERSDATEAELKHLRVCAEAAGCHLVHEPAGEAPDLPYGLHGPIGLRRYAHFAGVQWAVYDELAACWQLAAMRRVIEPVLADIDHLFHGGVRRWWELGTDHNDLSDASLSVIRPLLRAMGFDVTALRLQVPTVWTAEDLASVVPRGSASRSLHAFMRHANAQQAADALRETMDAIGSTPFTPRAVGRTRFRL